MLSLQIQLVSNSGNQINKCPQPHINTSENNIDGENMQIYTRTTKPLFMFHFLLAYMSQFTPKALDGVEVKAFLHQKSRCIEMDSSPKLIFVYNIILCHEITKFPSSHPWKNSPQMQCTRAHAVHILLAAWHRLRRKNLTSSCCFN